MKHFFKIIFSISLLYGLFHIVKYDFMLNASSDLYLKQHFSDINLFIALPLVFIWFVAKHFVILAALYISMILIESFKINPYSFVTNKIKERNDELSKEYKVLFQKKELEKTFPEVKAKNKSIKI